VTTLLPDPPRRPAIPPGTESCGCCAGIERATPLAIENRPGLSAVRYRIGDYAAFHVIDHYVRAARWEQEDYDRRVTDWEIQRGFERA
jgi:glutamine synthetase